MYNIGSKDLWVDTVKNILDDFEVTYSLGLSSSIASKSTFSPHRESQFVLYHIDKDSGVADIDSVFNFIDAVMDLYGFERYCFKEAGRQHILGYCFVVRNHLQSLIFDDTGQVRQG